jgi:hypothetical protein
MNHPVTGNNDPKYTAAILFEVIAAKCRRKR